MEELAHGFATAQTGIYWLYFIFTCKHGSKYIYN